VCKNRLLRRIFGARREKVAICWSGNLKGTDHLENLGVDVRIILEWILG
jgi:hypothetical protein